LDISWVGLLGKCGDYVTLARR